jgi:preprotein translocase subunit SecD
MGRRNILTLVGIILLVAFAASALAIDLISLPLIGEREGIVLGLDLRGGTHLVYEADFSEIEPGREGEAIEGARGIIEKRINRYGVSEPVIQIIGSDRISIQIPGLNASEAQELVGTTAELAFREQATSGSTFLAEVVSAGDTQITAEDVSGFAVGDTCVVGFLGDKENRETKRVAAVNESSNLLIVDSALFNDHLVGEQISAWVPAAGTIDGEEKPLTGAYLRPNTYVDVNPQTNEPVAAFEWNEDGAKLFSQITGRLIGKPLGIFLDDELISAPIVQSQIAARGIIEGLTFDEARLLSIQLNAGALPLPLGHWDEGNFYSEPALSQDVDATLGADSLQKSLIAGIIGLALVLLFMVLYYRLPGVLACVALIIYIALMLTIIKLVPVTLTLAHIAAFILSLGVAVDASILIFERMKEEIRGGKTLGSAVEAGFNRAWPAIRDSNISTFIICVILYWFGSRIVGAALVMGFALTLGIGVAVSMFTAIVITRTLLRIIAFTPLARRVSLFRP